MIITSSPQNISAVSSRLPYSSLKTITDHLNIPKGNGRGKEGISQSLINLSGDDHSKEQIERLFDYYKDHILYGDKIVQFYQDIDISFLKQLQDKLKNYKIPDNFMSRLWPNTLSSDMLFIHRKDDVPRLANISSEADRTHLIFSSVRTVNVQALFSPTIFGENRPDFINEYDEFIGIKPIPRQCFDVITIYNSGEIEIKVDYFKGDNKLIGTKTYNDAKNSLLDSLNDIVSIVMPEPIPWPAPTNFYNALHNLVENDHSIIIAKIGQSDNQACNASFSRRKRSSDVRDATVFQAGNDGLRNKGDSPKTHGIRARHHMQLGDTEYFPELIIESTPTIHQEQTPLVCNAIIAYNTGRKDFLELRSKLLSAI